MGYFMENKIYEIVCAEPEELEANYIITAGLSQRDDKRDYNPIKHVYIDYCQGDRIKSLYKSCVEGVYCIGMDVNTLNESFGLKDISHYKHALKELFEYIMAFKPDVIALPILDFSIGLNNPAISVIDDSIKFTFDLAVKTVREYKDYVPEKIIFYCEDERIDLKSIQSKIDSWVKNYILCDYEQQLRKSYVEEYKFENIRKISLDEYIEKNARDGFDRFIAEYLNKTGKKPSKLYNAAQISKQDYSKMITNTSLPKTQEKQKYDTVSLLLCCKLSLPVFNSVLASRGFALSPCRVKDLIIQYFILKEVYDIDLINKELVKRNLPVLGNSVDN